MRSKKRKERKLFCRGLPPRRTEKLVVPREKSKINVRNLGFFLGLVLFEDDDQSANLGTDENES